MGEQAEMMLDGTICNGCGVYIGQEEYGCPSLCMDCNTVNPARPRKKGEHRKVQCSECGKTYKKGQSIKDHMRVVHGIKRAGGVKTCFTKRR